MPGGNKSAKPNIILILADDLGYGDLGCYGSELHNTPWLDRMGREGMLLTDFYVASPVCSPSRAAIMTGCYPQRVGLGYGYDFAVLLPGDPIGLHPNEISLARLLSDAGYATKIIGKWHLGDRTIDGIDFSALLGEQWGERQPREGLFYYRHNMLNAVRWGKWKLHVD